MQNTGYSELSPKQMQYMKQTLQIIKSIPKARHWDLPLHFQNIIPQEKRLKKSKKCPKKY